MRQTRFVHVDPSPTRRTDRVDGQVKCQTCFVSFDTSEALRDHVGRFQLEGQYLAARMLEVQMHLPRLRDSCDMASNGLDLNGAIAEGGNDSDVASDGDEESDDDDDGGGGGGGGDNNDNDDVPSGDSGRLEDRANLRCPDPGCRRKKKFKDRTSLERHYQLHKKCYELCVFCRRPFIRIRQFLRYKCEARKRGSDKTKEFYRRERCTQLRKYSAESLNRMLNCDAKSHNSAIKRGYESMDQCSEPYQPPKRRSIMSGIDSYRQFQANDALPGATSGGPRRISSQPTPTPSFSNPINGSSIPSGSLVNVEIPSGRSLPFTGEIQRPRNTTWAPVFEDITITPYYVAGQQNAQLDLFMLGMLEGGHQVADPWDEGPQSLGNHEVLGQSID